LGQLGGQNLNTYFTSANSRQWSPWSWWENKGQTNWWKVGKWMIIIVLTMIVISFIIRKIREWLWMLTH
jgi:hypothetical protein